VRIKEGREKGKKGKEKKNKRWKAENGWERCPQKFSKVSADVVNPPRSD